MDTRSIETIQRNRRITWGGGLSIGIGLIGLPLVLFGVWPGLDHSPWNANTLVLALGVALCTVSYILGRISVAAVTHNRVAPPTRRPFVVAGVAFAVAVLCLLITLAS
ncbi:hypothetical protein GCM10022243_06810 [Saccharothrix violaceirubra]|uniref:Drug/metabolite transporter (DMT)-like permease n=1 Tax=Saccharothrix violaceirubra TaxID=413306 RepID=A0A7W7WU39_9PSEU|nr:hypothetical protein [Saccharothrix violaceirubra]MBB4963093.1 drug/metabolite transporter (DMT)-like permease [Saccharothrix violaceirubra]